MVQSLNRQHDFLGVTQLKILISRRIFNANTNSIFFTTTKKYHPELETQLLKIVSGHDPVCFQNTTSLFSAPVSLFLKKIMALQNQS